jgi:SAM-dependent methyltransferase
MLVPPKDRFDATAEDYVRHRPGYPRELVDWVLATSGVRPPALVADLGCGTGISTRAFAGRGLELVGIDPSDAMLAKARELGGATFRKGESTATGLADRSVALAISGQAFHWFDIPATFAELARILVPGGWCAAFWNLRGKTPFLEEYEALLRQASAEYAEVPRPLPTIEAIRKRPEVAASVEAEFPNRQVLDREGLIGRAFSSSYVAHSVRDRPAFERALLELFDRHQESGRVTFDYRAVAIAWRLR